MARTQENMGRSIKKLDTMHMEMIYTKQMPSMGSDMKQDIVTIRKKLDNKLKNID